MLNKTYPFSLPTLTYPYDALEPYIDSETVHIHYDKHYATYIQNLNKVLKPYPKLYNVTLQKILLKPAILPHKSRIEIMHNAGGVYNHSEYFSRIGPPKESSAHLIITKINRKFGSYNSFKEEFMEKALSVFGSGWTYLIESYNGELKIVNTVNQETPLPFGIPIIICDVWEHAYYLKYKNFKKEYLENFWNIVQIKN